MYLQQLDMEGVESNQDLDVPQTTDSGETIMLQLEDAAHLVLHQQGYLLANGSYEIVPV